MWQLRGALRYPPGMPSEALPRPLFVAVCLSLVLHLLAFFGGRQFSAPTVPPPPPLRVVVGQSLPTDTLPLVPQPERVQPAASPTKSVPIPSRPRPERSAGRDVPVMVQAVPQLSPTLAIATSAPASASPESMAPAISAVASGATGGASDASAHGTLDGVAAGVSADALREYRIELASAARRFRSYPALARSRGWEGVVEVIVVAGPVGLPVVQLGRTSGHAVLDEQAVDMLMRAVARTALPDGLRGRSFRVLLPIRFSLDE